jgi:hypothetical protein
MDRSARPRYLLFALVCLALAATAVWLALRGPAPAPGAGDPVAKRPSADELPGAEWRQLHRRASDLRDAGEDVHGDDLGPPRGLEVAGRQFLAFYLPYEVGRVTPEIAAGLRATASPDFAGELLRQMPRFPPGIRSAPVEAQLLGVDATALSEQPGAGQIVAKLRRSGHLEAAAFELHRYGASWLVTGVAG